eukprot:snap_masked-scaffold_37-processed-gene-1.7-mRNA-1 protein AED:1.00 eAED:1.00 QI:0/-1/0/0/-1/1/1/0/100
MFAEIVREVLIDLPKASYQIRKPHSLTRGQDLEVAHVVEQTDLDQIERETEEESIFEPGLCDDCVLNDKESRMKIMVLSLLFLIIITLGIILIYLKQQTV